MKICADIIDSIGRTPLIKIHGASKITGCNILGKAEYANPGKSVKDRAAKYIIEKALKRGCIEKGGTIVEGSAGNTGIGLTLIANALGIKTVIVIPKTQSKEKKFALKCLGAELIEVEAVPYKDPKNYIRYSEQIAKDLSKNSKHKVFWANQFDNTDNRDAHYHTTAPEIIEATNGKIDGFICAVGTGGTIAGVSMRMKEELGENIKIGLADPMGSALFNYYKNGELKAEGDSITEGIGQGRITANIKNFKPDFITRVDDEEALQIIFDLIKYEGLALGTSSGINVAGAIKMAKNMGKGHTIVTILCDQADRYASKIFNLEFLKNRNLPYPKWF